MKRLVGVVELDDVAKNGRRVDEGQTNPLAEFKLGGGNQRYRLESFEAPIFRVGAVSRLGINDLPFPAFFREVGVSAGDAAVWDENIAGRIAANSDLVGIAFGAYLLDVEDRALEKLLVFRYRFINA